jgi:hypothetical protein
LRHGLRVSVGFLWNPHQRTLVASCRLKRPVTVDKLMLVNLVSSSLRVLTWCCIIVLAILSLLPAEDMVRTGLPGRIEHFAAYAGSAAIAMAGYGPSRGGMQIISSFWVYDPGVPPALLARPPPGDRGFRGVGTWGALRRACQRSALAACVRLGALRRRSARWTGTLSGRAPWLRFGDSAGSDYRCPLHVHFSAAKCLLASLRPRARA